MEQHNLKSPESVDPPQRITCCEEITIQQPLCTLLGIQPPCTTYVPLLQKRLATNLDHTIVVNIDSLLYTRNVLCVIVINHPELKVIVNSFIQSDLQCI